MPTTRTADVLEHQPVSVRTKLAAAWTAFMFLYLYVDYLTLYVPGVIDDIRNGVVWKLEIGEGQSVEAGQTVAVIEAMKMESPVPTPLGGKVRRIYVSERHQVTPGAPLFALEPAPVESEA